MAIQTKVIQAAEPQYYHREYANDLGEPSNEHSWLGECQRVGLVALPFFSLYKPLSFPLSLAMGGFRTFNSICSLTIAIQKYDLGLISYESLQTIISVISLGATIFAHPLGMLVTTAHDLLIELYRLGLNLYAGEYSRLIENSLNIVNNALYLLLFLDGGLEIAIASLALQIVVGLYHSYSELRNGKYLEAAGHLGMAIIRGGQLHGQALKWHAIYTETARKQEIVNRTITALNDEIKKTPTSLEQQRLIAIAKRLSADLVKFLPNLKTAQVPGCCLYEGQNYLANVIAIAEKQEQLDAAIKYINTANNVDQKAREFFQKAMKKLQAGINVALPHYFHATRAGLEGIISSHTILQSSTGLTGPGTYISNNNEGDIGFGSHAFAIDEGCLVDSIGTFRTGRHPLTNVYFSLWASVLKNIPVSANSIAFIDTSANDIPYVTALLQQQNLDIEVVDRQTAESILRIVDLTTERRELPSFAWKKFQLTDYLPQNMYPRSQQGTFRKFKFGL